MRSAFCRALLCLSACAGAQAQSAFDLDGVRHVSPFGSANNATGSALALAPDGRFYVAGTSIVRGSTEDYRLELRRFNADGSDDAGFSVSLEHLGTLAVDAHALLVQPDGAVVVVYRMTNPTTPTDSYSRVVRYLPDGSADPAFTPFVFDQTVQADELGVLALQLDGKLLVAGVQSPVGGGSAQALVLRLNPNGGLDTGFGSDGIRRIGSRTSVTFFQRFYEATTVGAIAQTGDGHIVLGGTAFNPFSNESEILLARLDADGDFDPDFNGGAPRLHAHVEGNSYSSFTSANAIDSAPDGTLLVGGRAVIGSDEACLWQFDPSGAVQAHQCDDFGTGDRLTDVQWLPNGGAIGVGLFSDSGVSSAMMAFYTQGLPFTGSFSGRFGSETRAHSLSALAFDPYGQRLLSVGSGITEEAGLLSQRWALASDAIAGSFDLAPDDFDFGARVMAAPAQQVDSPQRTLAGVDPDLRVPLRVFGGTALIDGAPVDAVGAADALVWLSGSDPEPQWTVQARHNAGDQLGDLRRTSLQFGGVVRSNNLALSVGAVAIAEFESEVGAAVPPPFVDGFE